ncbi:MAG: PilZ domain-containing protein [Cyanobacteria bacterium K_DeepCast_35m_m2_023]|nr:PilZ domain-containing protein [Cyanobacteria bacterium K_DeepCast_35m_m2_023]
MSIREERRGEPRKELHRIWTVSVESKLLGHRRAQLLDYSASGMRLALDGSSDARPGERLDIHYPGTSCSYRATIAWCRSSDTQTFLGAHLIETLPAAHQEAS